MNNLIYEDNFHEIIKKTQMELELIKSEWKDEIQKKFYNDHVQELFRILNQHKNQQLVILSNKNL